MILGKIQLVFYLSFSLWKGKLLMLLKSEKMYLIEREKKIQIHNVFYHLAKF